MSFDVISNCLNQSTYQVNEDRPKPISKKDSIIDRISALWDKVVGKLAEIFQKLFGTTRALPRLGENSPADDAVETDCAPKPEETKTQISSFKRLNSKMQGAVSELCSTERRYNDKMHIYLNVVKSLRESKQLSKKQYKTLICGLKDILKLSDSLVKDLEGIEELGPEEKAQRIITVFNPETQEKMGRKYSRYTEKYHKQIFPKINELEKSQDFRFHMANALKEEAGPLNRDYPKDRQLMSRADFQIGLSSLAMEPVQRMPRYEMILRELANHSKDDAMKSCLERQKLAGAYQNRKGGL
jgi:hypothetical protein